MSQWPPNDPSPAPRDPSPAPPRVDTYVPAVEPPGAPDVVGRVEDLPGDDYESYQAPYEAPPIAEATAESAAPLDQPERFDDPRDDDPRDDQQQDDDGDGDIDETVFELNEFSLEQRRHLDMRLTGAHIVHRWEVGSDLVVNTEDADAVEAFLDEVENPDGFELGELDEFGEEVDDEAVYKAMSDLYVAADRLQHNADDAATAGSFHLAADGVAAAPLPFGFDPRLWAQVKELASSVVASLDADAEPDVVAGDARTLRQILANYV